MIRVVDLFGNQFPIPSRSVSTPRDLLDELVRHYEIQISEFTLYCRQKHLLSCGEALDESIRDGTVPVALVSLGYT
jgi:hypothetical protein